MDISFPALAVLIIRYTGVLFVSLLCGAFLYGTALLVVSPKFRSNVVYSFDFLRRLRNFVEIGEGARDNSKWRIIEEIQPDHEAVISRILNCMAVSDRNRLPPDIIHLLYPGSKGFYGEPPTYAEGSRPPTREERAILQLSKVIVERRIQLAQRVSEAYRLWQITSLTSIGLGMLTTIIVSVSTSSFGQGEGTSQSIVRLLAIIFPALSTAAAAAFAFYGPQSTWTQATRTLTSLTQLHGQMGLEVWNLECGIEAEGKTKMKVALEGWSKRFLDIQTISSAAGQGNPPQGGTAPGGGPDPGQRDGTAPAAPGGRGRAV